MRGRERIYLRNKKMYSGIKNAKSGEFVELKNGIYRIIRTDPMSMPIGILMHDAIKGTSTILTNGFVSAKNLTT